MDELVRVCNRIDERSLQDLFDERIVALIVHDYASQVLCDSLAEKIAASSDLSSQSSKTTSSSPRRGRWLLVMP